MRRGVTGVCLAAGSGSRMGARKAALELSPGVTVGSLCLAAALRSRLDSVIVVVRPEDDQRWLTYGPHCEEDGGGRLRVVVAEEASAGMSYSLRAGLSHARERQPEGLMVLLGDQPFVSSGWLDDLVAEFEARSYWDYVSSGDSEAGKPPVILRHTLFDAVEKLEGDAGARALLGRGEWNGTTLCEPQPLRLFDLDRPQDLEWARKHFASLIGKV